MKIPLSCYIEIFIESMAYFSFHNTTTLKSSVSMPTASFPLPNHGTTTKLQRADNLIQPGSFGTYPKPVRDVMRQIQDQTEARPDAFIRYTYKDLLDEARGAMSTLLNAPVETLVFVPNATTGVNTVVRNLVFEPGDMILYFETIYGACEKTVEYITETTPAKVAKVQYTYPVSDDWLVSEFKKRIREEKEAGNRVKIAIFDTVISMPGVRMPFERLTQACKEEGVLSCIDAAHGVGHVELDLGKLDPDFLVSNCHK